MAFQLLDIIRDISTKDMPWAAELFLRCNRSRVSLGERLSFNTERISVRDSFTRRWGVNADRDMVVYASRPGVAVMSLCTISFTGLLASSFDDEGVLPLSDDDDDDNDSVVMLSPSLAVASRILVRLKR